MAVKELLRWNRVCNELHDTLGRPPTRREWAVELGFSGTDESLLTFETQARTRPATRRPPRLRRPPQMRPNRRLVSRIPR